MPALIFDYDGLIIDSETTTANVARDILAERGVATELRDYAQFFGPTGPDVDAAWARWLQLHLGHDADLTEFDRLLEQRRRQVVDALPLLPGVVETIAAAREKGWLIGLATGHKRERLLASLERLGVLEDFDVIVTAAEVERPKPAPDIFLAVAKTLRVDAADCAVLEDSIAGYQAAIAAGMSVIVCPCEVTRYGEFPQGANVIASLHDLDLDVYS